jgi:hypothetical protein
VIPLEGESRICQLPRLKSKAAAGCLNPERVAISGTLRINIIPHNMNRVLSVLRLLSSLPRIQLRSMTMESGNTRFDLPGYSIPLNWSPGAVDMFPNALETSLAE